MPQRQCSGRWYWLRYERRWWRRRHHRRCWLTYWSCNKQQTMFLYTGPARTDITDKYMILLVQAFHVSWTTVTHCFKIYWLSAKSQACVDIGPTITPKTSWSCRSIAVEQPSCSSKANWQLVMVSLSSHWTPLVKVRLQSIVTNLLNCTSPNSNT